MENPAAPFRLPGPGDVHAEEGAALIRERSTVEPLVAVVLGSGLAKAVEDGLAPETEFAFEALPGFPEPAVPGNAGRLVTGQLYGVAAAVFFGRAHAYEGGPSATTLIPRLVAAVGIRTLVLTSSATGLLEDLHVGDLVVVEDHLNFSGFDPLSRWRWPSGEPPFAGSSGVYDRRLIGLAQRLGNREGVELRTGVYAAVAGPTYPTAAEERFFARAGASAVGTSIAAEAVAANALGVSVLAIASVAARRGTQLAHEEILAGAMAGVGELGKLLAATVPSIARGEQRGGSGGL